MATSREARMQERMRGAQRHLIEDVSFAFVLPVDDEEPEPAPTLAPVALADAPITRSTPNTSAKRKPLVEDKEKTTRRSVSELPVPWEPPPSPIPEVSKPASPPLRRAARKPQDVYSIPESATYDGTSRHEETSADREYMSVAAVQETEAGPSSRVELVIQGIPSSQPSVRKPNRILNHALSSPAANGLDVEEVTESPADAPGSGHRRRIRMSDVANSSSALQKALLGPEEEETEEVVTSSPLTRKSRKVAPSTTSPQHEVRRSPRLSEGSMGDEAEKVSPVASRRSSRTKPLAIQGKSPLHIEKSLESVDLDETPASEPDHEEADAEELDLAEEVGEQEAAKKIGLKRPRRSLGGASKAGPAEQVEEARAAKHRRKRALESPAKQQQPKTKKARKKPPATKERGKGTEEDGQIEVTVQRFSRRQQEEDGDADGLNSEIPFSRQGGVNAVDFLAQMCEEIINTYLARLEDELARAEDSSSRREHKTMLRTLEAFRAELRTRLLEHTIALDSKCSLQKRVRAAQKEKLAFREDILKIRAEREQVALRMDAIRIKHEEDSKVALRHLSLSSTMHDIDFVTEKGHVAPELSAAEKKTADLANLELLVSVIADQACSTSAGGGALKQVMEFNAFLERAAVALESR